MRRRGIGSSPRCRLKKVREPWRWISLRTEFSSPQERWVRRRRRPPSSPTRDRALFPEASSSWWRSPNNCEGVGKRLREYQRLHYANGMNGAAPFSAILKKCQADAEAAPAVVRYLIHATQEPIQ